MRFSSFFIFPRGQKCDFQRFFIFSRGQKCDFRRFSSFRGVRNAIFSVFRLSEGSEMRFPFSANSPWAKCRFLWKLMIYPYIWVVFLNNRQTTPVSEWFPPKKAKKRPFLCSKWVLKWSFLYWAVLNCWFSKRHLYFDAASFSFISFQRIILHRQSNASHEWR